MQRTIVTALLCLILGPALDAGAVRQPLPAPEWQVAEWLNGDPGNLADHRGKVILIDFFQLWCPGCKRFSVPLFNRWHEQYGDRDDVLIVSIHTVFEGHAHQSPDRLREFVETWSIEHPVGIDTYASDEDEVPVTMRRFRTGGTPFVVFVDKQGRQRFRHLGSFDDRAAEALIKRLLDEPAP
jgi:thiol-disulfide isomerase/thioredoxin